MALLIRNNKDIKGFKIKIDEQTHGIKILQLADDTTSVDSFSDLVINRNKTEGLW